MNTKTRQLFVAFITMAVLAVSGFGIAARISANVAAPAGSDVEQEKNQRGFEVTVAVQRRQLFDQVIAAHAQVLPHQTSLLNPMITGMVVDIKEEFEAGYRVRKGQVLAELDKTDFRYNLAKARQTLAGAQLKLLEQQALSDRAIADWESQRDSSPSGLAARTPQVAAAQAELDAAAILVEQAARDLAATSVAAPFDGWVVKRNASVGNVVDPSVSLAELIPADKVIVRVPLTSTQINKITLNGGNENVTVELFSADKNNTQHKSFTGLSLGSIVEDQTGQVFASGIVYLSGEDSTWLRPGIFLTAHIHTQQQGEYFAVPQAAVNEQGNIFVLANGAAKELSVDTIFIRDELLIVDIPNTNQINLISSGVKQVWDGMPAYARNEHHAQSEHHE